MASFANPDANGNFSYSQDVTNLVAKAHAKNCEVFISIGGGGLSTAIEDIYRNKTNVIDRPALINSLMNYVRSNDLDGVDVDLEGGLMSMSTYNDFILELIDSAHAEGKEVSTAFAKWTGGSVSKTVVESLDFINTMSYDVTGPWSPAQAGQHSPMSQTQGDYAYWVNKGTNPKNIVIGVPFYGYEFKNDNTVSAHTWCGIVGAYPNNLNDDQVTTPNGVLYYNGKTTIASKTQYAIDNAGGIMIWELGQDCIGGNSLLDVIIDEMGDNNLYVSTKETIALELDIYPNPTENVINVKGGFNGSLQLFNLMGKQVLSESGPINKINLIGLKSGVYLIQLKNNQGSTTKTIVKK
jgi:GH18 family chitinase